MHNANEGLLLPPALRATVLRAARQEPSPAHILPLAVQAVASAHTELRAQVQVAQKTLAKDAGEAGAARAAGQRSVERGDVAGSLPHFTRALQYAPVLAESGSALAVLYTSRAEALLAVGRAREALSDATEALLLAPLYAKAWRRYAAALPDPPESVRTMAVRLSGEDGDGSGVGLSLGAEDEALRVVAELRAAAAAEEDGA